MGPFYSLIHGCPAVHRREPAVQPSLFFAFTSLNSLQARMASPSLLFAFPSAAVVLCTLDPRCPPSAPQQGPHGTQIFSLRSWLGHRKSWKLLGTVDHRSAGIGGTAASSCPLSGPVIPLLFALGLRAAEAGFSWWGAPVSPTHLATSSALPMRGARHAPPNAGLVARRP